MSSIAGRISPQAPQTFPILGKNGPDLPPAALKYLSHQDLAVGRRVSTSWNNFISSVFSGEYQRENAALSKIDFPISKETFPSQAVQNFNELGERIQRFYSRLSPSSNGRFICSMPHERGSLTISVKPRGAIQGPDFVESCIMTAPVKPSLSVELPDKGILRPLEEIHEKFEQTGWKPGPYAAESHTFETRIDGALPIEDGTPEATELKQRIKHVTEKLYKAENSLKTEVSKFLPILKSVLNNDPLFEELSTWFKEMSTRVIDIRSVSLKGLPHIERILDSLEKVSGAIGEISENPEILTQLQEAATALSPTFQDPRVQQFIRAVFEQVSPAFTEVQKCSRASDVLKVISNYKKVLQRLVETIIDPDRDRLNLLAVPARDPTIRFKESVQAVFQRVLQPPAVAEGDAVPQGAVVAPAAAVPPAAALPVAEAPPFNSARSKKIVEVCKSSAKKTADRMEEQLTTNGRRVATALTAVSRLAGTTNRAIQIADRALFGADPFEDLYQTNLDPALLERFRGLRRRDRVRALVDMSCYVAVAVFAYGAYTLHQDRNEYIARLEGSPP